MVEHGLDPGGGSLGRSARGAALPRLPRTGDTTMAHTTMAYTTEVLDASVRGLPVWALGVS